MKKIFYILFILLFIFSCNSDSNPVSPPLDECGVSGGDNSTCTDECGILNGDNSTCLDECGIPDGDGLSCIPDMEEYCNNIYSDVDGSFLSCDDDCSLYSGDCYHDYDIKLLLDIRENNESLNETILLDIGIQSWTDGRLTELNISNLGLNYIPDNLCNIDCEINVSNNQLCQEYQFDCINTWGSQSGLDIMDECGICNGNNQDKDECGVCYGDNSCIDDCGIPNGNNQTMDCGGSCDNEYVELWGNCYNIQNTTNLDPTYEETNGQTIPPEIGTLENLTTLKLHWNGLIGEIPIEIYNLNNLTELYLNNNLLTGEISPTILNLVNLEKLDLSSNLLSGWIPYDIYNLPNLNMLNLSYNNFSGGVGITEEVCDFVGTNLVSNFNLFLNDNQFCPPYPDCFYFDEWYMGEFLSDIIGNQDISETNCPFCTEETLVDGQCLDECGIPYGDDSTCLDECGVPNGDNSTCLDECGILNGSGYDCGGGCSENVELWGNCYNIQTTTSLNLYDSNLTGEIPPEIGDLINLTVLNLGYNNLTGSIPSNIGSLLNLTHLYLNSNQLTGQVPENMCDLSIQWYNLPNEFPDPYEDYPIYFYINNNQLCPPYPQCIQDYIGTQNTSNCP